MEIGETKVWDEPGNVCFGCSPNNSQGLQLCCTRTGERTVEVRFHAAEYLAGAPGVIHGGIQATVLDEALGMAARAFVTKEGIPRVVTADFQLRYRAPAPTGTDLLVTGELVRVEGRDLHLEGRIQGPAGEILTDATARWVCLDSAP